jgi:hypothetical protein
MLKLNSLDTNVFIYHSNNDETIGTGTNKISRDELIASGRLCATEYLGKQLDPKGFVSRLAQFGGSYDVAARKHMEKKLLFCATKAYAAVGKPAPENVEAVKSDMNLWKDPIFLRTMSYIDAEVVSPLLYSVISDLGGQMLNLRSAPVGRTVEINVQSNEAFLWEDSAPGSGHSTTKNYLYGDTITLNPKMYVCNGTIKWFQLVASDNGMDAGWYYTAIIRGLWSKITALYTKALLNAATNTMYVPSYLTFDSYSSANWASATTAAAVANGVRREQLMAFGNYASLQKVLPSGTASDAALTYQLGEEWMRNGFVSMVGRVPLFEIMPAMVPGTVNTTGTMIDLDKHLFITARVGDAMAPIYGAIAEGWPVAMEYTPSETADFEISINMSTLMDFKPVFASKVAVIQNVI